MCQSVGTMASSRPDLSQTDQPPYKPFSVGPKGRVAPARAAPVLTLILFYGVKMSRPLRGQTFRTRKMRLPFLSSHFGGEARFREPGSSRANTPRTEVTTGIKKLILSFSGGSPTERAVTVIPELPSGR